VRDQGHIVTTREWCLAKAALMAAASGGVDLSMGASSSTRAWACGLPITSIRAGGRRRIPEPMCLAAEDEDKRARLGDARGVTDHKMHFPVEHVERLVVAVMHMQRYRRRPGRQLLLEYAEVRCARFNLHLGATAQEWPSTPRGRTVMASPRAPRRARTRQP
jgi:hypothetical protein